MKKALAGLLTAALALQAAVGLAPAKAAAADHVNEFVSDGTYTYYYQEDGTPMTNRLTYHPDGVHVIYFDEYGHEVFSNFHQVLTGVAGDDMGSDAYCYFDVNGYMYTNAVTYDVTGTKLYYINPYGLMEHTGWFSFAAGTGYGNTGNPWNLVASHFGYANADGTLITNQLVWDDSGNAYYMQGNGEGLRMPANDLSTVKTSLGFFQAVGASDAVAVLQEQNDISGYTKLGDEADATSLTNMLKSLDWIDECNNLRAQHGLAALKVTDYMMAVSQVQCNASAYTMGHTRQYNVGENLAWGYTGRYYKDPFDGWYTEEKAEYDAGNTDFSEVGHYLNIVNDRYEVTGFAQNQYSSYGATHEQSFSFDEGDTAYTVAEYRTRLQNYMASH